MRSTLGGIVIILLSCFGIAYGEPPEGNPNGLSLDAQRCPASTDWQFLVAPYAWLSAVSTDLTTDKESISADATFSDIWNVLDFAGFVHAEASQGKWGIFTDIIYIKLSQSTDVRVPKTLIRLSADATLKESIVELGGMRTFQGKRTALDVLAGARRFVFDSDLNIGPINREIKKNWIDPFVGGRIRCKLSEKWDTSLRVDLGGFGAGSDLTLNATALVDYNLSDSTVLGIGYRYFDVDYSGEKADLDMTTYGPILGVGFRF